jgi:hypothetical protein
MEHAKTSYERFLGSIPREHFSAKGLEEHIAGFAATEAARAVGKAERALRGGDLRAVEQLGGGGSTAVGSICGGPSTRTATSSTSWSNLAGMPRPPSGSSANSSRGSARLLGCWSPTSSEAIRWRIGR